MVRPGGLELPTFWFVGGFRTTRQHTPANKSQWNQRIMPPALGPRWLVLYPVHGQSHGQFFQPCARSLWTNPQTRKENITKKIIPSHHGQKGIGKSRRSSHHASDREKRLSPFCILYSSSVIISHLPPPWRFRSRGNQCRLGDNFAVLSARSRKSFVAFPSDCLPGVPQQLSDYVEVVSECPRNVRVLEAIHDASWNANRGDSSGWNCGHWRIRRIKEQTRR